MSGTLGIPRGIDRGNGAVVPPTTTAVEGPGDVGGDVARRPAHLGIFPRSGGVGRHHGRGVGPSGAGAGGALRQGGVAPRPFDRGEALRACLELSRVGIVLKSHLVALLGEPVELGGQAGVAGHHGPDASHQKPDAPGRVRLSSLGVGQAGLAAFYRVGDRVEIELDLAQIVADRQYLLMSFRLLLGEFVLLGAQPQYLLAQALLDLKNALAEAGDGGIEEFAGDGEHLLDLLRQQVGEDDVGAPAQSGAEGELDEEYQGPFC